MLGKSINKWVLAIALLCGFGHMADLAYAYGQNAQSDSWSYQSVYGSTKANSALHVRTTLSSRSAMPVASYGGTATSDGAAALGTTGSAVAPATSMPSYNFRSTSSLVSSLGNSNPSIIKGTTVSRTTSSFDWNEDDNPIGEVPDPLPIGETPWLIMAVLAAGYIAFRYLRRRNA